MVGAIVTRTMVGMGSSGCVVGRLHVRSLDRLWGRRGRKAESVQYNGCTMDLESGSFLSEVSSRRRRRRRRRLSRVLKVGHISRVPGAAGIDLVNNFFANVILEEEEDSRGGSSQDL